VAVFSALVRIARTLSSLSFAMGWYSPGATAMYRPFLIASITFSFCVPYVPGAVWLHDILRQMK
jgi:hypothetical protein